MKDLIESISPLERKVIPHLDEKIETIQKKTGLDETSVLRALRFLENKKVLTLVEQRKVIIELGTNGIYYKKNHLPERRLLIYIEKNPRAPLEKAHKETGLSDNEFRAALGALKKRNLIDLNRGLIQIQGSREDTTKKFPEEHLLEVLPKEKEKLTAEELHSLEMLKARKDIVTFHEQRIHVIKLTDRGKELMRAAPQEERIEELTPQLIAEGIKNKKFRRYNIHAPVPRITGGKTHFVNQGRERARAIWLDMGFTEMEGPLIDSAFWVFDALFTAQDHPVREMQDSFYLKGKETMLPSGELVKRVKKAHESGVAGSTGWNYTWDEEKAKHLVLRTHTTSLSARTLASLKKEQLPAKYFAIGKAFRNETIDWSHGIEFFQTEGMVIAENVTLRHLLGYLKIFYRKMGFDQIRFRPSFFPYTEPSVEIDVFHKERKKWLELGGAGLLRPEVTQPLLGYSVPVLAWGQGLDRMIMDSYQIKDLRELYANDIKILREKEATPNG